MINYFFFAYLVIINLLSAAMCSYDKTQARIYGRRVSEQNLFVLCILGGAPAMYFTMRVIRHKTRKKKFMIGIPVIMIVELAILLFLILR